MWLFDRQLMQTHCLSVLSSGSFIFNPQTDQPTSDYWTCSLNQVTSFSSILASVDIQLYIWLFWCFLKGCRIIFHFPPVSTCQGRVYLFYWPTLVLVFTHRVQSLWMVLDPKCRSTSSLLVPMVCSGKNLLLLFLLAVVVCFFLSIHSSNKPVVEMWEIHLD